PPPPRQILPPEACPRALACPAPLWTITPYDSKQTPEHPTGFPRAPAMLFESADQFRSLDRKAVTVFGMAGVGKTRLGNILRRADWFHFSVDFRIGTRHMGEYIVDNFKREAMKVPFLADLLRSDSISIHSNISFDNLDPLSSYLGTPGDPRRGGLPFAEYQRRPEQHRIAETYSLLDVPYLI